MDSGPCREMWALGAQPPALVGLSFHPCCRLDGRSQTAGWELWDCPSILHPSRHVPLFYTMENEMFLPGDFLDANNSRHLWNSHYVLSEAAMPLQKADGSTALWGFRARQE